MGSERAQLLALSRSVSAEPLLVKWRNVIWCQRCQKPEFSPGAQQAEYLAEKCSLRVFKSVDDNWLFQHVQNSCH